ncbi:MAG TPA: hypothetical protein VNO34_02760 [Actinomycetota bacterium]|nr:hypothetical protein [Actinomycetota bacterium]
MEAIAGFVVGYLLGAQQGREGLRRLQESWAVISKSEEFRGLVTSGLGVAGAVLQRGLSRGPGGVLARGLTEFLVERLRGALERRGLRAVA